MRELPTGTVTFLFTDIEGSTKMLSSLGHEYAGVLSEHRRLLREAFQRRGGVEVDTQGDAFFVAFASAPEAVQAAADAQRALGEGPVRVRMGLHTGEPLITEEGYVGLDVHKGARIAASAHGGQVVVSADTRALVDDTDFIDLGEHRLKDFEQPVQLFQSGDGLFPPLRTISNSNIPRPASSFIGREREVAEIVSLVRGGARLVTLSGPGGSGKTRVGIESATELISDFKAGAFWVPLSAVREAGLVLETIGQTIGAGGDLAKHIGEREMLLLVDNFEQVIEAAPDLGAVLESCPNLSLIVTSRELLRISGEVEYPVPPLAENEGVELFCARARMDPSDAIGDLCARLDDLPLAIELAAARANVLTPEEIIERLSDRLDLLKGGRDADPRQKTLRAAIEWSYDLLPPEEKELFADLAVFAGGCDLEAASSVCRAGLDEMQSLVEKSLVRRTGDRFWMLETIKELATELVHSSGKEDEVRKRHYDYFLDRARRAHIAGDEGDQHLELIFSDKDNYRAAFEYAVSGDNVERAADLAIALELWWGALNPSEGKQRVEPILLDQTLDDLRRGHLVRIRGETLAMTGDLDGARQSFEESLSIFRHRKDAQAAAMALERLAQHHTQFGNLGKARAYVDESAALAGTFGGYLLSALARIEYKSGDQGRALDLLQDAARVARETGLTWCENNALINFAELALPFGRIDESDEAARRGLAVAREIEDAQATIYGLGLLAWVASARGDSRRAGMLWGAIEAYKMTGVNTVGWPEDEAKYAAAIVKAGDTSFEDGRTEGRRLDIDRAVEVALS